MIVSTATGEYLGPSPQTLSIAKRAMVAALPHLKEMRIMEAHFRAIQPYLKVLREIPFREIQNHIQYLNSILPSLDFLRFVEKAEALILAQRQIHFYQKISSNANYRREKTFCSQVENSPPKNFRIQQRLSKHEIVKTNFISREDCSEVLKKELSIGQYLKSFSYVIPPILRTIIFPKGFFEIRADLEQEGFQKDWVNFISLLQFMIWRFLLFSILFSQREQIFQIYEEFLPLIKLIKFLFI